MQEVALDGRKLEPGKQKISVSQLSDITLDVSMICLTSKIGV